MAGQAGRPVDYRIAAAAAPCGCARSRLTMLDTNPPPRRLPEVRYEQAPAPFLPAPWSALAAAAVAAIIAPRRCPRSAAGANIAIEDTRCRGHLRAVSCRCRCRSPTRDQSAAGVVAGGPHYCAQVGQRCPRHDRMLLHRARRTLSCRSARPTAAFELAATRRQPRGRPAVPASAGDRGGRKGCPAPVK